MEKSVELKKKRRPVVHIRCYHFDCNKIANYGYPEGRKKSCAKHKDFDMINKSPLKCKNVTCDRFASYGIDGKRHYCSFHKTNEMIIFKGSTNFREKTKKRKLDTMEYEIVEFMESLKNG